MHRTFAVLIIFAVSVAYGACPAHASSLPQQDAKPANKPIAISPDRAPCDTADVLKVISKGGLLAGAPQEATAFISARIDACHSLIQDYITSLGKPTVVITADGNVKGLPSPSPPPANGCSSDAVKSGHDQAAVLRAYSMLGYCVSWLARNVPSPSAGSSPSPPPILFADSTPRPLPTFDPGPAAPAEIWRKKVYVLALASDAPTSAQISFQMTEILEMHLVKTPWPDPFSWQPVTYSFVPMPTWTLAQYQTQCYNDPSTAGAIVALPPSTSSASWNYLLTETYTRAGWQTMVLDCEPTNTAYVNNSAFITWISKFREGRGTRVSFSLSSFLALAAGVLAINPTHTRTYTFTPPSPTPQPGHSYESMYTTTGIPSFLSAAAAAGVAALTPLASQNIGNGVGVDEQTHDAVKEVVPHIVDDILEPCPGPPNGGWSGVSYLPPHSNATQCYWIHK